VQTEKVIELKKLDSDYWDEMIDGKKITSHNNTYTHCPSGHCS
jgi:hypothetical protein